MRLGPRFGLIGVDVYGGFLQFDDETAISSFYRLPLLNLRRSFFTFIVGACMDVLTVTAMISVPEKIARPPRGGRDLFAYEGGVNVDVTAVT